MVEFTPAQIEKAINTKEDAEVLNGLFLGNHIAEQRAAARVVAITKIYELI